MDDERFALLVDEVLERDGALCLVRAPGCLVIAVTVARVDGPRRRDAEGFVAACEACASGGVEPDGGTGVGGLVL
jgi:hypothetical protein